MITKFEYGKEVWFMYKNKAYLSHIYFKPILNKDNNLIYKVPYSYFNKKGNYIKIWLKMSTFDLFETKKDLLNSL